MCLGGAIITWGSHIDDENVPDEKLVRMKSSRKRRGSAKNYDQPRFLFFTRVSPSFRPSSAWRTQFIAF